MGKLCKCGSSATTESGKCDECISSDIIQGIENILEQVYCVEKDSKILMIVDDSRAGLYPYFLNALNSENVVLFNIDDSKNGGRDAFKKKVVPKKLEEVFKENGFTHCITLFECRAEEKATRIQLINMLSDMKITMLHGPGINEYMLREDGPFDYSSEEIGKLIDDAHELIKKMEEFSYFKVYTGKNHEYCLVLNAIGRQYHTDLDVKKGSMGNIPVGEVYVAPTEDSAHGEMLAEGKAAEYDLTMPVYIKWENGKIVRLKCEDKKLETILWNEVQFDEFSPIIGELGLGMNKKANINSNLLESEKAGLHLAHGPQIDYGSVVESGNHVDYLLLGGKVVGVLKNGSEVVIYDNRTYPILKK